MNIKCKPSSLLTIFTLLVSLSSPSLADAPFSKDVDHDGFPDDLEIATGFNPRVNEPLKKSSRGGRCGVIKTDLIKVGKPQNVLILLDVSGSMSAKMGTDTRMEVAKKVLYRYLDALPREMKVGFVIYGKSSCGEDSVEVIAPVGLTDRKALKELVKDLRPRGSTPLARTIERTRDFLKGFEGENNTLIIISDGMESCGGSPVQAIIDLKESEANPEVTVIGLNVDRRTRSHLSKIAGAAEGSYADVKSEEDFVKAFAGFFSKMNKFYKDIVCITRQYNSYLTYETEQYNKSKAYIMKALMKAKDDGTRDALKALEKKLEKNHREREEAKDKLNEMISNKIEEIDRATNKFIGKE